MPSLAEHHSSKFVKVIYIGDSSSGKTGSLTSLVADGYKLKVLDLDNGLDPLKQFVLRECADKIGNIDYETRRDKYRATTAGPVISGQPKAFTDSLALMTKWTDGSDPAEWGEDTIFVLDSLSAYGRAAFEWAKGINSMAAKPNNDARAIYFIAQQAVENTIALLTGESFHCNVIIISHVNYKEVTEGITKGYANAIGTALGPIIPRYFNTMLLAESSGSGKNTRRKIKTLPTGIIDLKNPVSFKLDAELPLETGMSTIFKTLKDPSNA